MSTDQPADRQDELRDRIMGMGNQSMRKSYYPSLQSRLSELEQYKSLLNHAREGIFLLDGATLRITDSNLSTCALLGASGNDLTGSILTDWLPDDLARELRLWLRDNGRGNEASLQMTFRSRAKGQPPASGADYRWLELGLSVVADRGGSEIIGILRDITEFYRQNEALKDSERTLHALFDNSYQFTGILNPEGILVAVNQTALKAIDATEDQVLGKYFWDTPWWEGLPEEQELLRHSFASCLRGEKAHFQCRNVCAGGRLLWIDFSYKPIYDDNGNVAMVIPEWRDITDVRLMEEQLHHSQKMDAIGQLAGGVAHDFNNMLSAITGTAELLMHDDPGEEMRREYLEIILKAASRAADLTQKLLSFARKGKKASTAINVLQVLKDSVAILARTVDKRVTITVNNLAETYSIIGDNSQLQNVFINMGINACHAMPEGGNLTFTLRNTPLDAIFCAHSPFAIEPGNYLEIEIQDSGCGMSPEVRSRIFEPFFTTREPGKGTGLGLSAVYGTVQDHHGAITVYSEVGVGTSFHIYLPLAEDGEEVSAPAEAHPLPSSGLALLIDDEDIIRITARAMLESLGFEVLTADGGEQGLEIFSARHGDISFVILDMVMPVMGGREVFARLRAIDPRPPVIISSGFSKSEDLAQMQDGGMAGFIHKPFRLVDLSRAISNALREKAGD